MQSFDTNRRHIANVLWVLLGCIPYIVIFKLPPLSSFWSEWLAVILTLVILASAATSKSRTDLAVLEVPTVSLSVSAFAISILIGLFLRRNISPGNSLIALAEALVAIPLSCLGATVRQNSTLKPLLAAWALGLLLALVINAFVVALQVSGFEIYKLQLFDREIGLRATGLFGQPNQLAVFAAIAWSGVHYLWTQSKVPSWVHASASLMVGLIGAGAGSRAGAIVWIAMLAFLFYTSYRIGRFRSFSLLVFAVVGYIFVQILYITSEINTAPDVNATFLRGDTIGRIELIRDSLSLIGEYTWKGVGFGGFSAARWETLQAPMYETTVMNAHNLVLQLIVELGAVSGLLVLMPLAIAIWAALRRLIAKISDEDAFCASVAMIILCYSLVEYPLWYTYFLLPLVFVLGVLDRNCFRLRMPFYSKRVTWAFAAFSLIVAAFVATDYLRLQKFYTDAALSQIESGSEAFEISRPQVRKTANLTLFNVWADLMLSRTLDLNGSYNEQKLAITRRVMDNITNEETIARHIAFLAIEGNYSEIQRIWRKTERNASLRIATLEFLHILAPSHPAVQKLFAFLSVEN